MDVTEWSVDQRMRFPDWCFGNSQIISVWGINAGAGTRSWWITDVAMPDPMCVWKIIFVSILTGAAKGTIRLGLSHTLPTSVAEMDATDELLPYYANPKVGHNEISFMSGANATWVIPCKYGIATGGQKIVMELWCSVITIRVEVTFIVSSLPTDMAGWLEHNRV